MDNPLNTNKFCFTTIELKDPHQLGNSLKHLSIRNKEMITLNPSRQKSLLFTLVLQIPVKMRPVLVRGTTSWTLRMTETSFSEKSNYMDLENDRYLDVDKIKVDRNIYLRHGCMKTQLISMFCGSFCTT